ncbi:hypothetical protein GCM10009615_04510 [Corynebacterium durum]
MGDKLTRIPEVQFQQPGDGLTHRRYGTTPGGGGYWGCFLGESPHDYLFKKQGWGGWFIVVRVTSLLIV